MSINGKMANILKDDMITCGKRMDLKTSKCKKIIEEVYRTVERFDNIARSVGIKDNTINLIHSELEKRLILCAI